MIDRQEVMDFAREFGLTPQVVEKDYTLGWLLAGIAAHPEIGQSWVFKGGTCLKKCYFETYRFSEDLDFTLSNPEHLSEDFLLEAFHRVADWLVDQAGIEVPADTIRFEVYKNPRDHNSAQGRVGYRGPMQRRGDAPRIKLDLTDDEILVLDPVMREVHHPYSDRPDTGIHVLSYDFEEVFAEKIRALAERERPRDLYDVVHLYRREGIDPDRTLILSTLAEKCQFKGIDVPTMEILANQPEKVDLEADWDHMLAHQLPVLPPFQQFWNELSDVFDWLHQTKEKQVFAKVQAYGGGVIDESWSPPPMAHAWNIGVPLEVVRFAAANRLCVDLEYRGAEGRQTGRLIEPYSLRRTQDGNILLYAVRQEDGQPRSYRVDRIQDATATNISFSPKYTIELTSSGPLHAPETERISTRRMGGFGRVRRGSGASPTYVVECSYCGRNFKRKTTGTTLKSHKDKNGYPCPGRHGYLVDTIY
ncbi:MAG: nucleotidyl transferase AbiEii/AbiGii toxin family protein [Candidatus Thiodiazotropha sp. (ex Ctena orbiculata)]|nr:nucleotidyl transferase AbiEii/AbiGii toxin family protein [Candidatus Thiodiazotropha taylori]MBT2999661.1 nucleotidyl transferase AbiEii/AbiGii toxin family protein [Candidatus Thiodiazotropha taylori]MBV2106305.1 nucleotidyl transferase AbiEii/AbiGii toxin family protein [Candidatus Thiodiazotropha taylori]MBV2110437.1 nucleotidyl transferase AbiEii/AbiGii toxin family protein [Candidatus Thiodiazotropha taylori]